MENPHTGHGAGIEDVHCCGHSDPTPNCEFLQASSASKADLAQPEKLDEIRTFLPGIGEAEYELRAKLRALRNTASAMVSNTESNTARQLAWIVVEYATPTLYAPGTPVAFADLNKFCTRLMLTAMQAENMDLFGAGQ